MYKNCWMLSSLEEEVHRRENRLKLSGGQAVFIFVHSTYKVLVVVIHVN